MTKEEILDSFINGPETLEVILELVPKYNSNHTNTLSSEVGILKQLEVGLQNEDLAFVNVFYVVKEYRDATPDGRIPGGVVFNVQNKKFFKKMKHINIHVTIDPEWDNQAECNF